MSRPHCTAPTQNLCRWDPASVSFKALQQVWETPAGLLCSLFPSAASLVEDLGPSPWNPLRQQLFLVWRCELYTLLTEQWVRFKACNAVGRSELQLGSNFRVQRPHGGLVVAACTAWRVIKMVQSLGPQGLWRVNEGVENVGLGGQQIWVRRRPET